MVHKQKISQMDKDEYLKKNKKEKSWNIIVDGEKKFMSKEEVMLKSMAPYRRKYKK